MLMTPGGSLSLSIKANVFCMASGTRSEGLRITVFPQAIAYGRNQNGIIAGKLKGAMIAHTPTG